MVELAVALMEAGCDEVGLSDTTGYANPNQVQRLIRLVRAEVGADRLHSVHLHNTRGLGLANALAALEEGITTLDSSLGGLGGCPYAPGASGNIVTEDLVFMLDAMGLRTGIDLDRLLEGPRDPRGGPARRRALRLHARMPACRRATRGGGWGVNAAA